MSISGWCCFGYRPTPLAVHLRKLHLNTQGFVFNLKMSEGFGGPGRVPGVSQCRVPSRTLVTKVTMAPAGCSGSSSANTWHALPPPGAPACFATNPKILGGPAGAKGEVRVRSVPPLLSGGPVLGVSARTWPWSRRCSSTWGG